MGGVYMCKRGTRMDKRKRISLGAHWDGSGVTFALASRTAHAVELCLFDEVTLAREHRFTMARTEPGRFCLHLNGVTPGQCYGYRVSGPWQPREGHFHNPNKLLLDPYARAVRGQLTFHPSQRGWFTSDVDDTPLADTQDSAAAGLCSVVVDNAFDWQGDHRPKTAWRQSVIYECHVKGMTALHPQVDPELRGTYLGLCSEPVIAHLRGLGVTAVSLLPVAASYTERRLVESGLTNYWGYQPIANFAPTPRYAAAPGRELVELKTLVRTLHRAGIEVILDVVLNHSGEGPTLGPWAGPLIGLRGIDRGYFRRDPHNPARDIDYSGCGNTLDLRDPLCRQLALDCLRYWADEFHVDGFRCDLAPTLGRDSPDFDPRAPLFQAIAEDPALQGLKWIAEPWDLGPNGYCFGRFPSPFREWNDRFRDAVRHYARGDVGARAELATRLSGSADVFGSAQRSATSSINYITCHDGFTLRDLVSYAQKHNADNGEHNRDGRDDNISHAWGVEGYTDDVSVNETRRRVAASMVVALVCAQGVPMLSHGDELGRTQHGNNNGYCQDNPRSYVHWEADADRGFAQHGFVDFVRDVLALRRERTVLRVEAHCHGEVVPAVGLPCVNWLGRDGLPLTEADWNDAAELPLGVLRCQPDDIALVLWNPTRQDVVMRLPTIPIDGAWTVRVDVAPEAVVPRAVTRLDVNVDVNVDVAVNVNVLAHCAMVLTWDVRA